jgi:hypothetical protein
LIEFLAPSLLANDRFISNKKISSAIFGGGYNTGLHVHFPQEVGGIQLLASPAASSQIVRSLLTTPWPEKLAGKMI